MANKCNLCGKFATTTDGVKCAKCSSFFHRSCANISPHSRILAKWLCNVCRTASSSVPMSSNIPDTEQEECLEVASKDCSSVSVATEIKLLRSSVTQELNSMRQELSRLSDTVFNFNKRVESIEERLNTLEKGTQSDMKVMTETITELRSELNEREQEGLLNDVVIAGLDEASGENTSNLVLLVAKKIGVVLEDRDIVSVRRSGPRRIVAEQGGQLRPRPIVVRLARRAVRDDLIRAARVRRGADSAGIVNSNVKRFYVNEHLTPSNRMLFQKIRELGRRDHWRFVWTRGGRIHARRSETSEIHRIRTHNDISKVFGDNPI